MKPPTMLFECKKCGAQFTKWTGRCEECGGWGTLSETVSGENVPSSPRVPGKPGKTQTFASLISGKEAKHAPTGTAFWDRLLSGGFVDGSVSLLGGEPGIGKSTLLAQLALKLGEAGKSVLYVTGEESPAQILLRLKRLGNALPDSFEFLDSTDASIVAATIREKKPALAIIDSIQTLRLAEVAGESGNPTQMKASASVVSESAKQSGTAVILVGQVTKEGDLAGPRLLEHLVDTVMMMEGDRYQAFRLLRIVKHRFGSTEESVILSMDEKGLHEVADPSAALIADRPANVSGTIVTCLNQGTRPLLVEIQALVNSAGYGTPSRRSSGIDQNRLSLLLAVLGRRTGIGFGEHDVFVNAVGGVDAKDPSVDLALALALASARSDAPIAADVAAWGEVGLSGEIRPVAQSSIRMKEAQRLGFKTLIVPKQTKIQKTEGIEVVLCGSLKEAIERLGLRKA